MHKRCLIPVVLKMVQIQLENWPQIFLGVGFIFAHQEPIYVSHQRSGSQGRSIFQHFFVEYSAKMRIEEDTSLGSTPGFVTCRQADIELGLSKSARRHASTWVLSLLDNRLRKNEVV